MRLHLVRHPAPLAAPGVCYGRSDLGVDPAVQRAALEGLRARLPVSAPLYSSPLQRCALLAAALAGDAARLDARLAELDFGAWELRAWDDIARGEVDAWAADMAHYRPGGGESVAAMAQRVSAFYDELLCAAHTDAIIICHAGTIRLLMARARGLDPSGMALEAAARPHAIAYGEVVLLDCV